jgi:hypothetical protein
VKYLLDNYFPDLDPYTRKLMLDNASALDTPPQDECEDCGEQV